MPDEQDMIWLKGLQFELNACNSQKEDMVYIIKLLQDELKKTKQYINSECRRYGFEYNENINKCLYWDPDSKDDSRFITKLKNEIKT